MACILCLDTKINKKKAIKIFSEQGEALNIKNIVTKHFWVEPKNENVNECVCQQCWNCVFEFHKFYEEIEKAHKTLRERSEKLFEKVDTFEKKEQKQEKLFEQDIVSSSGLPIIKRKRGRPKKSVDVLEEVPIETESIINGAEDVGTVENLDIFSEECQLKKDESDNDDDVDENALLAKVPDRRIPKRRGRPTKNKNKGKQPKLEKKSDDKRSEHFSSDLLAEAALEFDEIKDEGFDMQLGSVATMESMDDFDRPEFQEENSKKKYAKRKNLSMENDKFIAENYNLTCSLCQLPLENFTALKTHFRAIHKIRGYVLCCGKKLPKRGVLVDHIRVHQNPDYFKCTECGKVMSDRRCLEGHMKTHDLKDSPPEFTCEICSKSFHRRIVFMRHVQNHMPDELRKFECPECSKKFATKYMMNQHYKIVHLNSYSKICDVCGKKIIGREALERHKASHETVPPPPIQCDLCGLVVTTKYGLNRHMKSQHIADYQTPQICPFCSKVSPNLFAKKRHIYYMHSIGRRHTCPMCEKAFKRKKDLKEHMTTHTGDVLYTCPYCPKTFNSDANMYAHRKRKHRKEWEQKMREKFPLADMKEGITRTQL